MKNAYADIETANRYDAARALPPETKTLWLEALKSSVAARDVRKILDLGCGTGRFTSALGEAFGCAVVGVEPSAAMLNVARARCEPNVEYCAGRAEELPLENGAVDLVFMSQVFHHFDEPRRALEEISRVLIPEGYLAVRNGTREQHEEIEWIRFFPEALELEEKRMPSRREVEEKVCAESFELVSQRIVRQLFASSYEEYFEKISRRGLSSLITIGDDAFQSGLRRLRDYVSLQPRGVAVYEPVDLFVFQKLR
jgi:ubiquinone/menaquinone biosynthesis C-methylase UbiE